MQTLLRTATALLTLWATTAQAQVLTLLSTTSVPNGGDVIAASPTRAYAFTGRTPLTFVVYDISVPTAPVRLTSNTYNGNTIASRCLLVGNTLYSASLPSTTTPITTDLLAFDVTSTSPRLLGKVTLPGEGIALAASGAMLCALTLSSTNPSATLNLYQNGLTPVSSATLPGSALSLTAGNQTAYVQYVNNTAFIPVDLTTPTAPVVKPSQPGSIGAVSGQLAFGLQDPRQSSLAVSPPNTLTVYDVSAPLTPRVLNSTTGQMGRTLKAGTNCVFTLKTIPYTVATDPSRFPLRAYSASASAPTPVASNDVDIVFYTHDIDVVGDKVVVIDGVAMSVYSFKGAALATKPTTAPLGLRPYPNPAHGTLTIPQVAPTTPITISDGLGRVRLSTPLPPSCTLNIEALPTGLYQVRAGSAVSKLTVE